MKYKPLSLAHGFPDFFGPKYITDTLAATANTPNVMLNQYARGFVSDHLIESSICLSKCI